jgi:uncharacterized membrane protein YagU involved in acid resistance
VITASITVPRERRAAYRAIVWGGLIAGVLDLTAAFVTNYMRGLGPIGILQSIASGLLGTDSYKGGLKTAALGAVLHFFIAFTAATVFYLASRKFHFLVQRAVISGLLYGVAVYLFMNLIVLPLSAFPHKIRFSSSAVVTGLIIHMLCVGLPISLVVKTVTRAAPNDGIVEPEGH